MNRLAKDLQALLTLIDQAESRGFLREADEAHSSLIRMAQQAQGNAYSLFDYSTVPPAVGAMLANLNYKVTQLTNTQQQMAQQMGGVTGKAPKQQQPQQQQPEVTNALQNANQNTVMPNTVNYVQTPGSNPAPITIDDGEINV